MLRAVLATVHLRLLLRGYGLRVGVALVPEAHHGHVAIHQAAVAAQVAPPEIHAQRVLGNGLLAAVQDEILGHAVAAVVHVAAALEEIGARLAGIRRAECIGMVIVVEVLQTHHAHVVLPSGLGLIFAQQRQHLLLRGCRSVPHVGPVHTLRLHVHEVLAFGVLARVPLGHVALEEVQDVVHLLSLGVGRGHQVGFPERLGLLKEPLSLEVEARRARAPEDVVQVHHASSGRPLEHRDVVAGAEHGHLSDSTQFRKKSLTYSGSRGSPLSSVARKLSARFCQGWYCTSAHCALRAKPAPSLRVSRGCMQTIGKALGFSPVGSRQERKGLLPPW